MKTLLVTSLTFALICSCQSADMKTFKAKQQKYPRVLTAIQEKDALLRQLFADRGILYPPEKIFIRVFKQEKILELWAFSTSEEIFKLVRSYTICRTSGNLGPKRREGICKFQKVSIISTDSTPKAIFIYRLVLITQTDQIEFWATKASWAATYSYTADAQQLAVFQSLMHISKRFTGWQRKQNRTDNQKSLCTFFQQNWTLAQLRT